MSYLEWIRKKVGSRKIFLVFAGACICDERGYLLWQRRSDFGWWGLPGGILELNETLPECIIREVKEETGLEVEPTNLVGLYTSPDFEVTYPNKDQVHQVTACFACEISGGKLQTKNLETLDLDFFDPHNPPKTSPWYLAMTSDFIKRKAKASFKQGSYGKRDNNNPYFKYIRSYIGKEVHLVPTASAFIQDKNGYILLQKRGDTKEWGFPGGMMELGERIDLTLKEEVFEETGLKVEPIQLIGIYCNDNFFFTYPNGDKVKGVNAFFRCQIRGGNLQADGVESLEVCFFPPDKLPSLPLRCLQRLNDGLANCQKAFF